MSLSLSQDLRTRIDRELPHLMAFPEDRAAARPAKGGWSPKEELGHLIDSAANNHVRFVIGATSSEMRGPGYAQDDWVRLHDYQNMPWARIVSFWHAYNTMLADLIARIPEEKLGVSCFIGAYPEQTLGFVIQDYGVHLQHHVDHLLGRGEVTPYPQL